jgi:DNA-binding transcriptional MerR regulator
MSEQLSGANSPYLGRFRHSEAWTYLLSSFDGAESGILSDIKAFLLTEKYSAKDTDITYRLVNTWCKAGIMADRRKAEDGWRRLTFTDLIWLHLLIELRKFGLSIDQLAVAYKTAFYIHGDTQKPWNAFAVGVAQCFQKTNISIVVFNDGFLALAFDDELALHAMLSNQPYIKLNLNQLVRKVHPKLSHAEHQKLAMRLSAEELEVISTIQEDDLDKITIRLKDGKIQNIDKERTQSNYQGSLNELTKEMSYGEVTLSVKEGRIAYVKQKESKKI